jgi:plasmid stability protein
MAKTIQIRNVPEAVHRKLKSRASRKGLSLTEYLRQELARSADQLTMDEFLAKLKKRPVVHLDVDPVEILRRDRDSH